MTLEDRLNELETAIQTLRLDMQAKPEHKFNVGDAVITLGKVVDIDRDTELPYLVEFSDAQGRQWFAEHQLQTKAP